jgi:hypothetical protein
MKSVIAMLSLVISVNVFAESVTNSTALTTASPLISSASSSTTSGTAPEKQAVLVLNDAQEFIQSGNASAFLSQKIKEVQEANAGASESDALEMLVNEAESILSK